MAFPQAINLNKIITSPIDLAIICIYATSIVFIGWRVSLRLHNFLDFALAGRMLTMPFTGSDIIINL
jgi:Na+/proline symporter